MALSPILTGCSSHSSHSKLSLIEFHNEGEIDGYCYITAQEGNNLLDEPKLDEILTALKSAGVLQGGNISTAVGYLTFRNKALHADWQNVTRVQVESCLLFVESLIREHLS